MLVGIWESLFEHLESILALGGKFRIPTGLHTILGIWAFPFASGSLFLAAVYRLWAFGRQFWASGSRFLVSRHRCLASGSRFLTYDSQFSSVGVDFKCLGMVFIPLRG